MNTNKFNTWSWWQFTGTDYWKLRSTLAPLLLRSWINGFWFSYLIHHIVIFMLWSFFQRMLLQSWSGFFLVKSIVYFLIYVVNPLCRLGCFQILCLHSLTIVVFCWHPGLFISPALFVFKTVDLLILSI